MQSEHEKIPVKVLIVEHDQSDIDLCLRALRKADFKVETQTAENREEFGQKVREFSPDVVLSDFRMPGWTGMDALADLRKISPAVPLILVTGTLGDELAVDCIKKGITDYVLKEQLARLPVAIRRAREEKSLREAELRAEQALRESEERNRTLVEHAPEAIVVHDLDKGVWIECNPLATRLFGMPREELLRHGPADLSPPFQPDGRASSAAASCYIQRALKGEILRFEWTHRNAAGADIPCEVHLAKLPSTTANLVRGSILDITDRKQAEAALRASEARYRGLVDNATYGIYGVTHDGEILFVNPTLVKMLGYESAEDLLGLPSTHFYKDTSAREKIREEFRQRQSVNTTVEWRKKTGEIITVRIAARCVNNPQLSLDYIEVIVEDITERLILEKQLQQAQKFEGIGQLAGGIAHDFNNMIGAIIGWADIGRDETEPGSRLRRHFEKVRHQADRAAALTKQLLAFARRQMLEPRNIDLNASVLETVSLLEKVIGSNIEIKANLAHNLAVVCADPTQVDQVLMNLCINARDAMPNGGSLLIETSNATLDDEFCTTQHFSRPGRYALLTVTDSGTGMDGGTLDRIFEPFFTTKELGKGTGLGLATVYGIVQQHNGFLHVESEVGKGTTFQIYLPASEVGVEARPVKSMPGPVRGGTETVLIAEDHEGLRQLASETLAGLGYKIVPAVNGEDAVKEFHAQRDAIDILLLDVVMPKLSGPEVYAQVSAEKPDVSVVFTTGYSSDIDLLAKAKQKNLPVIQKPYSPNDLARQIRETLDKRVRAVSHIAD